MICGLLTPVWAQTSHLEFGPGTVLVFETQPVTKEPTSFVMRIARFQPDIVLEWETVSYQGTLHLSRAAVRSARKITTGGVFEPGIDAEAEDWTVKWLSRALYEDLIRDGKVKAKLNNIETTFKVTDKGTFDLTLNGQSVTVPVAHVVDGRRGQWTFLDDPENPMALAYQSPYYREALQRVATDQKKALRWIKRLPPVQ